MQRCWRVFWIPIVTPAWPGQSNPKPKITPPSSAPLNVSTHCSPWVSLRPRQDGKLPCALQYYLDSTLDLGASALVTMTGYVEAFGIYQGVVMARWVPLSSALQRCRSAGLLSAPAQRQEAPASSN